jgi:hypothetical protein
MTWRVQNVGFATISNRSYAKGRGSKPARLNRKAKESDRRAEFFAASTELVEVLPVCG